MVRHEFGQGGGIMDFLLRGHADGHAVAKGNEFLHDGHVEGNRRQGQGHMGSFRVAQDFRVLGIRVQEIEQIALGEHHALGLAGGAGGEDAVSQVVLVGGQVGIVRSFIRQQLFHRRHGAGQGSEERFPLRQQFFRHDEHGGIGILRHHPRPFVGIIRGDGQERGSGL